MYQAEKYFLICPNKKKLLGNILLYTFLTLLIFTISIQTAFSQNLKTYENSNLGIKFSYPTHWGNVIEDQENCIENSFCLVFIPPYDIDLGFIFSISAYFKEGSEILQSCKCDTLMEFVQYEYKEAQRVHHDFSFLDDNETLVGKKYPAWQFEYSLLSEMLKDERMMNLRVVSESNDMFYSMDFTPFSNESYARELPSVRKVIGSIEFFPVEKPAVEIPNTKTPSFMNINKTEESDLTRNQISNVSTLQIVSDNSFRDSLGYLHIVGEVKNGSPSPAEFVKVIATYYDNKNQVVGTEFTFTNPSTILIGNRAPFELILTSASIPIDQIERYKLSISRK